MARPSQTKMKGVKAVFDRRKKVSVNNKQQTTAMKITLEFTVGAGRIYLTGDPDEDLVGKRILAACASPVRAEAQKYARYAGIDLDIQTLPAPMTWAEAWEIKDDVVRAAAMSACRCNMELMEKLRGERIHVDGVERPGLRWDKKGNAIKPKPYAAIYELWKADLSSLASQAGIAYVVRCWCTTTGGEAWIWCKKPEADHPTPALEAIASTFLVPVKAIEAKCGLMRQGDLMIVIADKQSDLEGERRPLTAEEYRELLIAES